MFWTDQNFYYELQIVQELQEVVKTKMGIIYDRMNWLGFI